MKVQPVVKRDTLRLAVGMVAPVVLTVLGFWGAGRLDYTVVLGALLGYLVTVGNFFLLALTIQNNTEMAEREGWPTLTFLSTVRVLPRRVPTPAKVAVPFMAGVAVGAAACALLRR